VAGTVLGGPAALIALALANLVEVAAFRTARLAGRIGPVRPVPLGPLLVVGFTIAGLLAPAHPLRLGEPPDGQTSAKALGWPTPRVRDRIRRARAGM